MNMYAHKTFTDVYKDDSLEFTCKLKGDILGLKNSLVLIQKQLDSFNELIKSMDEVIININTNIYENQTKTSTFQMVNRNLSDEVVCDFRSTISILANDQLEKYTVMIEKLVMLNVSDFPDELKKLTLLDLNNISSYFSKKHSDKKIIEKQEFFRKLHHFKLVLYYAF